MTSKAFGLAQLGNVYNDGALSNRNLIINGAMQVAQRGTSVAGKSDALYHTVDRFVNNTTTGAVWTYTQESDAPSGFSKSFKCEVTTANASPATSYYSVIQHRLEGQNLQSIAKGTSDANPVTVSFWAKSNVTGTYQFNLVDVDNTRLAGNTYSISSSGVWEYKTITIPADAVGVLGSGNQESLTAEWWLSSGTDWSSGAVPTTWEASTSNDRNAGSTVNLADTIGNYFQITGVQLEVGDTATPFEHRSYGQELALCQRYYEVDNPDTPTIFGESIRGVAYHPINGSGGALNRDGPFQSFKVNKRASPTLVLYSYAGTAGRVSPITTAGDYAAFQVKNGPTGFQVSSSVYGEFHVWFAWSADAEL